MLVNISGGGMPELPFNILHIHAVYIYGERILLRYKISGAYERLSVSGC
jgi:hypothetical protein